MNTSSIIIKGKTIDSHTRCIHYNSPLDIIAIKFKCCGEYYPCYKCHDEEADHKTELWAKDEFNAKAVLCGMCRNEMTIAEYLVSGRKCPNCNAAFNPNCKEHYNLYFDL